jgi:hypothetical protein
MAATASWTSCCCRRTVHPGRSPLRLWHSDADGVVLVAMGRYLAQEIPHCRADFVSRRKAYPNIISS